MNFYKHTFKSMTAEGLEERDGYKFDYLLADGTAVQLGIYKFGKHWMVIDLDCGMMICEDTTRSKAVAKAEEMRDKYTALLDTPKYKANVEKYRNLLEPKPVEIKVTKARIIPTEEGVKAEVIEEHTETVDPIDKRVAEMKAELAEKKKAKRAAKKAAKAAPKPEPKPETAIAVSLETMQAWCKERNDVIATQKREGCCIWVEGATKPYRDELVGLGFRWGKKRRAWYYDPKRVA